MQILKCRQCDLQGKYLNLCGFCHNYLGLVCRGHECRMSKKAARMKLHWPNCGTRSYSLGDE